MVIRRRALQAAGSSMMTAAIYHHLHVLWSKVWAVVIFKVKYWVILRASLPARAAIFEDFEPACLLEQRASKSSDLRRLRASLLLEQRPPKPSNWVISSQPQHQHGSPVSAWQRNLFLCWFGRSFATITLSCQVRAAATFTANDGVTSSQPAFEQRSLKSSTEYASQHSVLFPSTWCSFSNHTTVAAVLENAITFSLWLLSLCFFKTHGAADKNKTNLYITNKQKLHYKTHTAHRANDKWTQEVMRSMCHTCPGALCAILAQNHPANSCWNLGCTFGIRVRCWHWYLGASWAAKTKQMFSLPLEPHFFLL